MGVSAAALGKTVEHAKFTGPERGNGKGVTTRYSPKAAHFRARDPLNSLLSAAFRQLLGGFSCYPFPVTPFGATDLGRVYGDLSSCSRIKCRIEGLDSQSHCLLSHKHAL